MKHLFWTLLAVSCALALGCDDDDGPGGTPEDGSPGDVGADAAGGAGGDVPADSGMDQSVGGGGGDAGDPPDGPAIDPDMAADPDMPITPDAAPDGPTVDPEADAGMVCMEADDCGENHGCHDGACRWDLRPAVYRMVNATVNEPAAAAPELTAALTLAVQTNALNLLFEPGYYGAGGAYEFFVGNGTSREGGGQSYDFIHTLPIPRFAGHWRLTDDGVRWTQDEDGIWLLNVPSGSVEVDGEQQTCFVRFPTTVRFSFWPGTDDAGNPVLHGRGTGHLLNSDVDLVVVQGVAFRDFFGGEAPDLDLDGDGVFDAYSFDLEATSAVVPFHGEPPADDGSNRDPEPPFVNPEGCDE